MNNIPLAIIEIGDNLNCLLHFASVIIMIILVLPKILNFFLENRKINVREKLEIKNLKTELESRKTAYQVLTERQKQDEWKISQLKEIIMLTDEDKKKEALIDKIQKIILTENNPSKKP